MGLPTVIDTWWEPSEAQVRAAKATGWIVGWSGYLSNGHDSVYHGWADATFRMIVANGMLSYGYCSGLSAPGVMAGRAKSLGITAILDVESTIRPDGAWVDPWLAASPGVGIYGSAGVMSAHGAHGHAGYQLGGYPGGDPGLAWPAQNARPNGPMAWQYTDLLFVPGVGTVDGSHFGSGWNIPAVTPPKEIPMSGCFRPGTNEYHWAVINDDKSVSHWYVVDVTNLALGAHTENLGGIAGGPADLTWNSAGDVCVVGVIGSDSKGVDRNVWSVASGKKWSGWTPSGTTTLQFIGAKGDPGAPGPPGLPGIAGTNGAPGAPGVTAPHAHNIPASATAPNS
jgi:hypothetical protein